MKFVMGLVETFAHLFHPRRSNNHRPRVLHPETIFFLVLVASGFVAIVHLFSYLASPAKNILGFASSITPIQVVEQTNQERAKLGLDPLVLSQQLSTAALAKGQDMFADQYWAHTAPDGTEPWAFIKNADYSYQLAGENLARDFGDTGSMVQAWMASPTHRANIVNSRYQEIGVAVIDGSLEGYETTLVVQMFGTPSSPRVAAPAVRTVQAQAETDRQVGDIASITQEEHAETQPEMAVVGPAAPAEVLASSLIPMGSIDRPPLFTPLQLTKAFFLAVIMMITTTLLYDSLVIGHRHTMRVVGQNLAHLMVLMMVAFLVIFFKGGIVG